MMFSSENKISKTAPALQLKATGNTFFRKAGEEHFFGARENPPFFNKPVQAKLTVSSPDDQQEKEADAVADKVMRMPDPLIVATQPGKNGEKLERKEEEEIQAKQEPLVVNKIQCKEEADHKFQSKSGNAIHRSERGQADGEHEPIAESTDQAGNSKHISLSHSEIHRSGRSPPYPSIPFEQTLASSKGGGSALPEDTRTFMESRFNADFSGVRIHTDPTAQNLSSQVNAKAFAHGNDIYFNSGQFSPRSTEGGTLLAHELTHTIQQGASKSTTSTISNKNSASQKNIPRRKAVLWLAPEKTVACKIAATDDVAEIHQEQNRRLPAPEPGHLKVDVNGNLQQPVNPTLNRLTQISEIQKKGEQEEKNKAAEPEQDSILRKSFIAGAVPPGDTRNSNVTGSFRIQLKASKSVMEADTAYKAVINKVKNTAQQAKKHDPPAKKVKEAQNAAKPPANEKESKAKDKQASEMAQQEPGAFDEGKFKAALKAKIAELQLNTLKEAEDFKKNNKAASVKGDMASQVSSEKDKAAGNIEGKTKEAPPTGNMTGKEVGPPPAAAGDVPAPSVSGVPAAPKPVPPEDVSLQKGSQDLDKQMSSAKVTEQQLAKSNEPDFKNAIETKKTAQKDAVQAPQKFRKDEKGILGQSQAAAAAKGKTQLGAIVGTRKNQMGNVLSKQEEAKAKDEAARAKVAANIEQKFNATKTDVETILSQLEKDVNSLFDKGIADATKQFEDYVDQQVYRFKVDRYLVQVGGALLWAKDLLLGLPEEVNLIYKRGKDLYIQKMDGVINEVAKLVVRQLNAAKKRISIGKQEIKEYVDTLPRELKSVGSDAAKNIQAKFSDLESSVNNKQNELVDSLAAKYKEGLDNVDKKIAEMKEANKGLVDKAKEAIGDVINTIIELKNMLLNVLARAAAAIELIIADPIGFLGNLVAGVKQGIMNFMGKIGQHLKAGLMGWLFGTLAQAGIQMPQSFDLKGILSLVLQVLGLTYANIRARAVNIVGEKVVKALETAAEVFIIIKNEGIGGLWRFIKEKVEALKDTVIESIKSFVIEKIVVAGVTWLISLLNPASAFVKACKMIYDVIMFFVTRGSQILDLVNAVINSVTAIAKGAIGVAAAAVENALAKALPVAISFLASLLGLGGISEKIKAIIAKIQAPINAAIDWVINKAVALVKAAGKLLGFGKDKDKKDEHSPEKQAKIDAGIIFMRQEQSKYLKGGKMTKEDAGKVAATVKANHAVFSSFTIKEVGAKINFIYTASGPTVAGEVDEADTDKIPDNIKEGVGIKHRDKESQTWSHGKITKIGRGDEEPFKSFGSGWIVRIEFKGYARLARASEIKTEGVIGYRFDDGVPDHDLFKPKNLLGKGTQHLTYQTHGGASFEVQIGDDKLVKSVKGTKLKLKKDVKIEGRGRTERSEGYVENQDLNASHLIADQFQGSGYKSSANLITTSAHFNNPVMTGYETQIKQFVIVNRATEFDLDVSVTWGEILNQSIIEQIVKQIPETDRDAVRSQIQAFINTVNPPFKRVMNVLYDVSVENAITTAKAKTRLNTGPDLWLGVH